MPQIKLEKENCSIILKKTQFFVDYLSLLVHEQNTHFRFRFRLYHSNPPGPLNKKYKILITFGSFLLSYSNFSISHWDIHYTVYVHCTIHLWESIKPTLKKRLQRTLEI